MLAGLSTRPYTENIFNVFIAQCPMRVKSGWGRSGQPGPPLTASDIEENRFVVALDTDVEAVDREPIAGLLVGNQRPTAIPWDADCPQGDQRWAPGLPLRHPCPGRQRNGFLPVSYTHLRAHETDSYLVCR